MSRVGDVLAQINESFPRVSGDEPPTRRGDKLADAFSPRERG